MKTARTPIQTIAILGGGVAGSTLALRLARAGRQVTVISAPLRSGLVVGESLLPAVVPLLQELGLEERVRSISTYKPGVVFTMRSGRELNFDLARLAGVTCTYAYNVPRPAFDALLRAGAAEQGARVVDARVKLVVNGDRVELDRETLVAAGLSRQPDYLVDSTGRSQILRRTLGLGGSAGKRKDTCLFAHYDGIEDRAFLPGCAVITAMNHGWCWRIPLPGRMSVGVVLDTNQLRKLGQSPEERLQAALHSDPIMKSAIVGARRVSEVMTYTNYQWITESIVGENWAMVGDSAGFVDPTLSSGVLVAMQGASGLADALLGGGGRENLQQWAARYTKQIVTWQELVDYFYDGRLFAMIMQGEDYSRVRALAPLNRHIERNFTGVVMGARTMGSYSRGLVRFMIQRTIRKYVPAEWAIR